MRFFKPRFGGRVLVVLILMSLGPPFVAAQAQSKPKDGSPGSKVEELKRELDEQRRMLERLAQDLKRAEQSSGNETSELPAVLLEEVRKELESRRHVFDDLSSRVAALEQANGEDQADRVDTLEEQVQEIQERIGSRSLVEGFDGKIDLGGFLTQSFSIAQGDKSSQVSFNQTQFELLIRAQVSKDWTFFTALGFLREADLDLSNPADPQFRGFVNRVPQIISWTNYRYSDALQAQFGRYVTPHGIINIEHFPPALLETNQPQFLRPFSGSSMFPNFVSGLHLYGKFFTGRNDGNQLKYNLYTGVFGSSSSDLVAGGRLSYGIGGSGFTFGANYGYGRRDAGQSALGHFSLVGNRSLTNNFYNTVGTDILYDKGRLLWKNEFFYSLERGVADRVAAYTQPAWRVNEHWIMFYRYDYFDPGQGLTDSVEHVVGFNYLPVPTIRFRGSYFIKGFESPFLHSDILQLSLTVSF